MTEPVKPIGKSTAASQTKAVQKQKSNKINIGGVIFDKNQIDADKTSSYTLNGKKINTVFVKPGIQIDFPDQKNPNKKPSVESMGLRKEWYNPDDSYISITDLENAKIYGDPDKTDFINLKGKSSSNEIFVDKKESWYINGNMRKDYVELDPDTENNTVHMDEKDETQIWYNQFGVEMDGETVQSEIGYVQVEGKGESSQEEQLKASLSKYQYNYHKRHQ